MPVSRTGPSSPLLFPAAGLAAGIAAGHYFIAFPYTVSLASLLALAALVLLKKIPPSSRVAGAAFYLAGLFAFFAWGPGAESPVSGLVGKGPVALTGEVVRPPQEKNGYTVAFLRPDGARAFALFRRGGLVRLRVRGERLGIKYGDVLSGTMELEAPAGFRNQGTFDWGAYVRLNGEDAVAYAPPDKIYRLGNRAWPPLARLYSLRQALTRKAKSSMRTEASTLFNAMVLGDQGGVTDSMRDGFSASGTTHILSVSGSHVALLAALIYFMVKWSFSLLPHGAALRLSLHADQKKLAAAVAIPVSIFYCALTGAEVATVRSVVMITVFLAAVLLDRESDLLNTLSISALAVLVLDPSALFD
ncbi:MAG TPA: ComEC/Rec2 family competence protein, partial [Nitrospirota bacterium]|nr:ComEC/Rec2 family competence protein [Nitrospirota bacterium]